MFSSRFFSLFVLIGNAVSALKLVPKWEPTYDMRQSTIVMPCNFTGWYDTSRAARFGVADFDWSNAKYQWCDVKPMDCEEKLVQQAKMTKAAACPEVCPLPDGCTKKDACPHTRVWVYRNLVKALPWLSSVREKLEDPSYSGWFLQFKDGINGSYHVPPCDKGGKCSALYHDQQGLGGCSPNTPVDAKDCGAGLPCGEYLFDHRNDTLKQWLVDVYTGGPDGMSNPNVEGFYIDDSWSVEGGPSEMYCQEQHCLEDMGLSQSDVVLLTQKWKENTDAVHQAIVDAGGFSWYLMANGHCTSGPPFKNDSKSCTSYMRDACKEGSPLQDQALFFGLHREGDHMDLLELDEYLASFLIVRGPYAWLGYSWIGCNATVQQELWSPRFDMDYGQPQGLCKETAESGVFTREWTKATVTMDCNRWKGTVVMK